MAHRKIHARLLAFALICILLLTNGLCPVTAAADDAPVITGQPQSVMVPAGQTASVSVAAEGTGLTYQWYRKLATETTFTATDVTTPTYSIPMTKEVSGQHVYCVVTDAEGNSVNSGFAVLNCSDIGITFTSELTDRCVKPSSTCYLRANAKGPVWKYAWFRTFNISSSFYVKSDKDYSITVLSKGSVEYHYCIVTSHAGYTVATNIVKFTTNEPKLISCSDKTNYVSAGDTVTLYVDAVGDDLTYSWGTYSSKGKYLPGYEERQSATLTFTMTEELSGVYVYCVIKDTHGNKLETHDMYVYLPRLEITEHPQSMELVTGMEATASVKATGEELHYQWYCKYEDEEYVRLPCAEPDLYLTLTEAGEYRIYCEVTDKSNQTKKSYTALLEVYAPVYIERDLADNKARNGNSVSLNFLVEGCGVTYQWYCKEPGSSTFTLLDDKTASYCSFPMTSTVNGRQLYCIATDKAGNTVTSSIATATLDTSLIIQGNCDSCGGDGNCDRCGGDGWYYKTYFNGYEHVTENVRCDGALCMFGDCMGCGGDGWSGSKDDFVPGDANSDKQVNLADVLMVLQHDAGWDVSPHEQTADVNASGTINVQDALLLLLYIADPNN